MAADPVKEKQEDAAPPCTQAVAHVDEIPRRAALDDARTTPRPSRVDGSTARVHPRATQLIHHAMLSRPRSPGRAATSSRKEPTIPRCAPPPPRDASFGRPRVNHSRVHLVQDRLPYEARDADAVTAAPTPCHVQASRSHDTAGSPSVRTPAAPHTPARAVLPRRPKRRPCRRPCCRSRWRSSSTAPFQGRRMNRPSPRASNTTARRRRRARRARPRRRWPSNSPISDVSRPRLGALPSDAHA